MSFGSTSSLSFRLHKDNTVTKSGMIKTAYLQCFRLHKDNTVTKLSEKIKSRSSCFRLHKNNTVTKFTSFLIGSKLKF